ncbi:autotransporter outer membrane beta-barrel domain-containing protein [Bordetella petrii]|uniref:autotransporter outer membrane beta-barrel domain-containing protein n=1 Tax=Bordetella petrii TaxID=94624 RepID=UPI001A979E00|nr:autotransporter outer membrane beta-barrel domain-containing protein [Bordetella petrii]MBO1110492.1 autotransporter outer membrane beta-barrel domain-containing protein [Bordetella petrii]
MKARRKLAYRRRILISSVATSLLAGAGPAAAGCSQSGSLWQCDYGPGETYTSIQGVSQAGYSPPHDNGTTDAGAGPSVSIDDDGATFTVSSGFDTYRGVLYGQTFGGQGEDAGKGGGAGTVSIWSSGTMQVTVNGAEDSNGNVATSTPRAFITGISQGGDGEQDDNDDNDSNGGAGANGNDVKLFLSGSAQYELDGAIVRNFEGVLAQSGGGQGGRQNSALFDNQHGGAGGAGQLAKVQNSGSIKIGAQAPIQSSADLVSGIRAWSFGGYGGRYNGNAGAGGTVEVDHGAGAELQVRVNAATSGQEIYGIMAESEGAHGYHSEDNDDRGGQGGGAGAVTVNVDSGISVDVTGAEADHGAAVHASSRGGKGGTGPNGNTGGDGGDAGAVTVALNRSGSSYTIATSGDKISGVTAISRGGEGGDGADNTAVAGKSGGGGFGGDGGEVEVDADKDVGITTSGDFASGIVAMSLGGGGGTGGEFVGIIGGGAGNGGNGGDAGNVKVASSADIDTQGAHAYGIVAQSISGGGGAGGVADGLVLEVGGDGQAGGTPGEVQLSNGGAITTAGYGSHGIVAQSIADGGGAAGGAGGIIAIGGNADSAHESNGGKVSASNYGSISTLGDAAKGLLVQSIGGGGGSAAGTAGILSVGGQGQAGGNGGEVELTSIGTITTAGEYAHGAQVQSIGGGGGDGGNAFDLAIVAGIGVGGVGEGGGDGGTVTVSGTEEANIVTTGYGAVGLLAHSVGKGGGAGGYAFGAGIADLTFQIGGDGGGSGSGGLVTVDRSNLHIQTAGGMATGLDAQSIGGGGGTGGGVVTDALGIEVNLNMSVGGEGGVAGDGGEVKVSLDNSSITTTGSVDLTASQDDSGDDDDDDDSQDADGATAILAQSIGGGGGTGGNSIVDNFILGIPVEGVGVSIPINLTVGGKGGAGGNGGNVNVDLSNTVLATQGQYSRGIHAQSIGGGGGNGGDSSIYSLAVDFPDTVNVQLQASVGGQCSDGHCMGGDGAAVDVAMKNTAISTAGDYATGVLAQSIGGGGGSGGAAYSSSYAFGTYASVAASTAVGGKGAVGGDGGLVNVTQDASSYIVTTGSGARGIVAQSVGGGGGESQGVSAVASVGGNLLPGEGKLPSFTLSVAVGREGAGGGNGAAATVNNAGIISTLGRNSDGIMAQSIGGGGGMGGSVGASYDSILNNVSALINHVRTNGRRLRFNTSGRLAVGIGGTGGAGGNGDLVTVANQGDITTAGDYADGIVAQSIGGGGGEGGLASVDGKTSLYTGVLAIGGSGGGGGLGGQVDVDLLDGSSIVTQGGTAYGVLAQSIGGGGGLGNMGSAIFSGTMNIGSGVGGTGGNASDGGAVNFAASGNNIVQTLGDGSHGIVLQSVGNGGGAGGTADYGANSYILDYSLVMSLGGHGGDAGNGGTVTACGYQAACSAVNISTAGDQAAGLIAQSVGGGGGLGGINTISNPKRFWGAIRPVSVAVGLELGGNAGAGGDGGNVVVEGDFSISTQGDFSPGLLAQSIGGGGGMGGAQALYPWENGLNEGEHTTTQLTVHLGGRDGDGGDGGVVSLQNNSNVITLGDVSHGMVAQSIGGGGGVAGAAVKALGSDDSSDPSGALPTESELYLNIGGDPGDAPAGDDGDGDDSDDTAESVQGVGNSNPLKEQDAVSVAATGSVSTGGDWAMGVLAQSIGGGGGAGYVGSNTGDVSSPTSGAVNVGGGAGSNGYGGDIAVRLDGAEDTGIVTSGSGAYGVLAQSIGGGGGLGVSLASGTGIKTNVGGAQSSDSSHTQTGGTVRLYGTKTIVTGGADAHGVVLQSIGGGGGVAGMSLPADGGSVAGDILVGGTDYGDANRVVVDNAVLRIGTAGDRAFGLVAQSIGGGGGIAAAGAGVGLSQVTLGGQGDAVGHGGEVAVTLAHGSQIYTQGRGSHGVVAQSIGGGGGIAGDPSIAPLSVAPSAADGGPGAGGGDGSTITLAVDADIVTEGEGAFGILAQSIGGGGGLRGDSSTASAGPAGTGRTGKSGMIHLTQTGTVSATGSNSVGIFAQSQGPTADGGIDVTINGSVAGGSGGQGAGIWMVGGNSNWIGLQSGAHVSAASGVAIRYDGTRGVGAGSSVTVENYGVIAGDILLHAQDSDQAGTVNNMGQITSAAATLAAPAAGGAAAKTAVPAASAGVLVGARRYDANVVNDGTLIVGRNAIVDSTAISGDFTQGTQGTLLVDADFGRRNADRLHVQGDARLAGTVDVAALSLLPGRRLTVLTVDGDATGQLAPRQSPIFDYSLTRAGQNYQLSVDGADFTASSLGLSSGQAGLAGHLQEIWDGGAPDRFGKLFAAMDQVAVQGGDSYRELLSNLSPDVMLAPATQMQAGMMRFGNSLMSCPTFKGADAMTGESDCVWGQITHRDTRQDRDGDAAGFSNDSTTYQVGAQKEVAPHWFVGVSAAYQNDALRSDGGRVASKGDSGFLGVALKREIGPWLLAAGLSGSYGSYDTQRQVGVPGFGRSASSDPDVYSGAARLRVARTFAFPTFYLKPYMDVDAIYSRMPGYQERDSDLALKIEGSDQFTFAFSPTLEIGGRVEINGATLRPYAYAGATFLTDDEWKTQARFAGAPDGSRGFQTSMPIDDSVARVGAGLQISTHGGVDVRLQYEGEFSGHASSNSGSLKVGIPF